MTTTFSQVIFNAREQALTSDVNRLQALANRDLLDLLKNASIRDAYTSESGAVVNGLQGSLTEQADVFRMPYGDPATYGVTLIEGQAFMNIPTANPDESVYSVVRWPTTNITTIIPNGSQIRVDLIIATPAMGQTDLGSRNLIVDAVARTVTPATVFKTNNPLAAISVVTGTPGSSEAPACPTGSLALCEVITKSTDTHSNTFRFVPRIWRRMEAFSASHAILKGCVPESALNLESASSDPLIKLTNGTANYLHTAIIDGEVISITYPGAATGSSSYLYAQPDTNYNPLTATIDANKDVFCYLYLCGGRHAPQNGSRPLANYAYGPLQLVASLTPPNGQSGRASADLATSSVTIPKEGTLYIGVWAIIVGTHYYKACIFDGDWVHARTKSAPLAAAGFNRPATTGVSGNVDVFSPATATMCDLQVTAGVSDTPCAVTIMGGHGGTTAFAVQSIDVPATYKTYMERCRCDLQSSGEFSWSGGATDLTLVVAATGFNMNVPRIG